MTELYQQEQGNLATGGSSATQHTRAASEAAYQKRAESLLADENCYKVVIVSVVVFLLAWITIALASLSQGCCEILFSFTVLISDALFTLSILIPLEHLVNTFFLGFSLPKVVDGKFKVSLPLNCVIFWSSACTLVLVRPALYIFCLIWEMQVQWIVVVYAICCYSGLKVRVGIPRGMVFV